MANLVLNGKSIDSIDDIAENFVEEDVLREFRSGSLSSWLEEYGYEEELERVRSIKPTASSIRVLAGISEALNLDDDVIAEAAARREEQRRKEEAARKAREEQQRKDEEERRCSERETQQFSEESNQKNHERNDDMSILREEKPSYAECINDMLYSSRYSSDIERARNAVRKIMKWYGDEFLEDDILRVPNGIGLDSINIFGWCALLGKPDISFVLRKERGVKVWLRKSPGVDDVRIRVGNEHCWLYDGFISELRLDKQSLVSFWSTCQEYMNLGQDKYMAPSVDYYVTEAIAKYFQW